MAITLFRSTVNSRGTFDRVSYPVRRETLKMYIVIHNGKEKHILKEARKRWAYPTTAEADESAIQRYRWALGRRIKDLSVMICRFSELNTASVPIFFDEEGWPEKEVRVYDEIYEAVNKRLNVERYPID